MEKLDLNLIDAEKNRKDKVEKLINNHTLLGQFLLLQNNIFKFVKNFTIYEFCLWIKYMNFYILRKNEFYKNKYKKGDIVYIELGTNIGNELSYIHPCVILEENRDNIFIIPCSSSKVSKIYDKKGNIYKEYILASKNDGFTKDTVLLLNNIKWVSKTRIVNTMGKVSKELLNKLYEESFKYNYSHQFYQLKKVEEKNIALEKELSELKEKYKIDN
jgi:mRNA-degrading endonuclease toxin of MazEF toxin-antitoxin module